MSTKAPSEQGGRFADWFRSMLPEGRKLPPGWREQWARCFDDMLRLDGRTPVEIRDVCQWARTQSVFWRKNFLTPLKLRQWQKDGEGNQVATYFDVFAEARAADAGTGPALPALLLNALESCHLAFAAAAKRTEPFRLHVAAWHALLSGEEYAGGEACDLDEAAAQLAADARHVAAYLRKAMLGGSRNSGALKLARVLAPATFFAELAEARQKMPKGPEGERPAAALHGPRTMRALPAPPTDAEQEKLREGARALMDETMRKLKGEA